MVQMAADLIHTVDSTSNLLQQFIAILSAPTATRSANVPPSTPDPLDILHDAAALLKAQTTKLSLLLINKPFTPSAIRTIVTTISSSCIPAMMSAVEICQPEVYGVTLHAEAKLRVRIVLQEYQNMMSEVVEAIGMAGSATLPRERVNATPSRDSLTSTGVVWAACDSLMALKQLGLAGLVVKKAQQYREMLEDAARELKEWVEDADAEDELDDDTGSYVGSAEDDFLDAAHKLPKDRDDLNATLASTFKKLRLTSTLYQALIKRRLKTLFAMRSDDLDVTVKSDITKVVDELMESLRLIPDHVDDLANAFYELDNLDAQVGLSKICALGRRCVKLTSKSWTGEDDEFTAWSRKWIEAIDQS